MRKEQILELIKAYAVASLATSENPQKLLNGTMSSDEAAKRMNDLLKTEEALFTEEICKDANAPNVLSNHYLAIKNPACMQCWLSSSAIKHENCETKLKFYFNTRKALIEFGGTLKEIK